jgi:hypothetical protein
VLLVVSGVPAAGQRNLYATFLRNQKKYSARITRAEKTANYAIGEACNQQLFLELRASRRSPPRTCISNFSASVRNTEQRDNP